MEWSDVSEEELYERYDALYAVTRGGGNRARLTMRALVAQLEEEVTIAKQPEKEETDPAPNSESESELAELVPEDKASEPEESEGGAEDSEVEEDGEEESDVYNEAIKSYIGDIRTILEHIEEYLE